MPELSDWMQLFTPNHIHKVSIEKKNVKKVNMAGLSILFGLKTHFHVICYSQKKIGRLPWMFKDIFNSNTSILTQVLVFSSV